jgi:hypothetical protein
MLHLPPKWGHWDPASRPLPVSDAKVAFTVKLARQLVKQVRTRAQDAGLSLSEFVGQAFRV